MAAHAQGIVPDPASSSKVKTEERNTGGNNRNQIRDQNRSHTTHANQFITMTRELAKYAGRTCSHSGAIRIAIIKQEDPVFNLPTLDPSLAGTERRAIADIILAKEYDLFVKRKATYLDNKTKMYAIAYGQCSEAMRAKLE
eukprot:11187817-Ditylum_brightwellii.AAC.1